MANPSPRPCSMKMLVSLLLALLTVKVSSVVDKRREDPSTRQEYLQVRDAGLSAAVCQQHIHAHSRDAQDSHFCQHLHSALAALRALNFASIAVYDCSTLHHHAAHLPSNRTAPLICTDVSYSSSSTDGRMDQADVFVMIGNSLVPSLPSSAPAAHQQHAAATLASLGAKSRVCLYLHTGASAHLLSLSLPGHAPSAREQRAAVRNLGAYDQVLFISAAHRDAYAALVYPLFSAPASSHSGHPTLASIPPRLLLLPGLGAGDAGGGSGAAASSAPGATSVGGAGSGGVGVGSNGTSVQSALSAGLAEAITGAVLEAPVRSLVRSRLAFLRATVPLDHPRSRHHDSPLPFGAAASPADPRSGAAGAAGAVGVGGATGVGGAHNSTATGPTSSSSSSSSFSSSAGGLVALIVEPRVEGAFEFCVRNVLAHLGADWGLEVHHSLENAAYVRHVLHDVSPDRVAFLPLPTPFHSSGHYNQLLKSAAFWTALQTRGARHVLVFQSDALLLEGGGRVGDFLRFAYVGAPWAVGAHESSEWLHAYRRRSLLLRGVGNGGLSLRSVEAMLAVAGKYKSKNPSVNEDVFFCQYLPSLPFELPSRQQAYDFSREVPCPDLNHSRPPFGVHNHWAYLPGTEAREVLGRALPLH